MRQLFTLLVIVLCLVAGVCAQPNTQASLKLNWNADSSDVGLVSPDGYAFYLVSGLYLSRYDAIDGGVRWSIFLSASNYSQDATCHQPTIGNSGLNNREVLFVTCSPNFIYAVDAALGEIISGPTQIVSPSPLYTGFAGTVVLPNNSTGYIPVLGRPLLQKAVNILLVPGVTEVYALNAITLATSRTRNTYASPLWQIGPIATEIMNYTTGASINQNFTSLSIQLRDSASVYPVVYAVTTAYAVSNRQSPVTVWQIATGNGAVVATVDLDILLKSSSLAVVSFTALPYARSLSLLLVSTASGQQSLYNIWRSDAVASFSLWPTVPTGFTGLADVDAFMSKRQDIAVHNTLVNNQIILLSIANGNIYKTFNVSTSYIKDNVRTDDRATVFVTAVPENYELVLISPSAVVVVSFNDSLPSASSSIPPTTPLYLGSFPIVAYFPAAFSSQQNQVISLPSFTANASYDAISPNGNSAYLYVNQFTWTPANDGQGNWNLLISTTTAGADNGNSDFTTWAFSQYVAASCAALGNSCGSCQDASLNQVASRCQWCDATQTCSEYWFTDGSVLGAGYSCYVLSNSSSNASPYTTPALLNAGYSCPLSTPKTAIALIVVFSMLGVIVIGVCLYNIIQRRIGQKKEDQARLNQSSSDSVTHNRGESNSQYQAMA